MLKHLAGTMDYGLAYRSMDGVRLVGYTESYWVGCVMDRKRDSRHLFNLGSIIVLRFSRKKILVALNFSEAEYMASSTA